MSELKLENLISEKALSKALGISRATLLKYRSKGCPYLRIGGRVFYGEQSFMEWIMKNCARTMDSEAKGVRSAAKARQKTPETTNEGVNEEGTNPSWDGR